MYYEIRTDRLLLRPLDISDLETVHLYASDADNTKYMFYLPNKTKEETAAFLNNVTLEWKKDKPVFYEFAIVYNNKQIGAIQVNLFESDKIGEIGWIISKQFWNKGIGTEAALAIIDFAFNVLKVDELVANCDYRNVASYSLMKKIGMTLKSDSGIRTYPQNNETAKELIYSLRK